jgi:hypothetical protein
MMMMMIMDTLHEDFSHLWSYRAEFFSEWKYASNNGCREDQNTHFMFSDFFRKSCPWRGNVEKYGGDIEAADNMAHARQMLDK